MENSASDNEVILNKSDCDMNEKESTSDDAENSNNICETAPESENSNIRSDATKELEIAAPIESVEDVNKSEEISENDSANKCDDKEECEKVSCPYCDFVFQEFTRDIFRDHLKSVHNITKSLDILVEFALKSINRGNCIST